MENIHQEGDVIYKIWNLYKTKLDSTKLVVRRVTPKTIVAVSASGAVHKVNISKICTGDPDLKGTEYSYFDSEESAVIWFINNEKRKITILEKRISNAEVKIAEFTEMLESIQGGA